jgi:hypothetical protein
MNSTLCAVASTAMVVRQHRCHCSLSGLGTYQLKGEATWHKRNGTATAVPLKLTAALLVAWKCASTYLGAKGPLLCCRSGRCDGLCCQWPNLAESSFVVKLEPNLKATRTLSLRRIAFRVAKLAGSRACNFKLQRPA